MNMLNCKNECNQDHSVNKKYIPTNLNVKSIYNSCTQPCEDAPCHDIREGVFNFSGPKTVRSLCDSNNRCQPFDDGLIERNSPFKHSFPIYRKSTAAGCDKIVGAIWRNNQHEYTIKCEGNYYIKYTWNNCYETEPKFEEVDICCDPCCK